MLDASIILNFEVHDKEKKENSTSLIKVKDLNLLCLMRYGSHLYGTSTPASDTDIKGVFIPSVQGILSGDAPVRYRGRTKVGDAEKNSADDIDIEIISLKQFLKDLKEGQTYAFDMLFANREMFLTSQPMWRIIQENSVGFLSKNVRPFIAYCLEQAAKYGVKGSRLHAAKMFLTHLENFTPHTKVGDADIAAFVELAKRGSAGAFVDLVEIKGPHGKMEPHISICKKKVPFKASVKTAVETFEIFVKTFGERAKLAETNEGVDWKALMHAVRVINEAKELVRDKKITFPRPEAEVLKKIRSGGYTYKEVETIIEDGVSELEILFANSSLPDKPLQLVYDTFLYGIYHEVVSASSMPELRAYSMLLKTGKFGELP